jgi:calcium-dependent protein kinase
MMCTLKRVGTPYIVAPEIINGKYDDKCDAWGIDVITYLLVCGVSPFGGCDPGCAEISGNFKFEPKEIWAEVSQDAKVLRVKYMDCNFSKRNPKHLKRRKKTRVPIVFLSWLQSFQSCNMIRTANTTLKFNLNCQP